MQLGADAAIASPGDIPNVRGPFGKDSPRKRANVEAGEDATLPSPDEGDGDSGKPEESFLLVPTMVAATLIPDERKSPACQNDPQVEIFQSSKVFFSSRGSTSSK